MLGVFSKVPTLRTTSARADTFIFKLHYKFTFAALITCCILTCSYQFIGKPIQCIIQNKIIREATINMYCWISSTFSVPKYWNGPIGTDVAYPGLGNQYEDDENAPVYHAYYQWVPFMLFFQALLFYTPHYIWRVWDGGRMKVICQGLNSVSMLLKHSDRQKQEKVLSTHVVNHLHDNNGWAWRFVFCEVLNFINVIWNIRFTDIFLGNQFSKYGAKTLQHMREEYDRRDDPLTTVFPKVTKCTFHTYGPSGTIQRHDSLCVMALNIINEKIYVFIWFWFIILAIITGLSLLYRIALLVSPGLRYKVLQRNCRNLGPSRLETITRKCQYGDWFLLHSLGRNMNSFVFGEFMGDLSRVMDMGNADTLELRPLKPSAPLEKTEYSLADAPEDDKLATGKEHYA
ncbi:unnamed protein product [Cyprideis torosa]|uniref:Innexin n=1 Tax=Cyprideis torosa TaxID=163714 RepID=A0A7R8WMQ8_9CRUS|nr:unnamed protein product [Cyprideis torosa]CAG0899696.1 unnamed protein product [Cyprideis torosa]